MVEPGFLMNILFHLRKKQINVIFVTGPEQIVDQLKPFAGKWACSSLYCVSQGERHGIFQLYRAHWRMIYIAFVYLIIIKYTAKVIVSQTDFVRHFSTGRRTDRPGWLQL
ncbi:MAG: hypothetical protein CSA33_01810 [Desulfobulbus propionicus]|nr:MAG: hypothetical protein CSA33_01810 [Desulfobulbus propionicus]